MKFIARNECPACGGRGRVLYRCPFDEPPVSSFLERYYRREPNLPPGEYRAEECLSCGTIYQAEVGDHQLLEMVYGDWIDAAPGPASNYHFDVAHPRLSRDGHEIMSAAAFLNKPLSEMVTLDYGMGWGAWARTAHALGCQSYGFDLSPSRHSFARAHGIRTNLEEAQFDFINTEQFFEHAADPRGVAEFLVSKLAPAGVLKISVPSNRGLVRELRRLRSGQAYLEHARIDPLSPLEHVNCFTLEGLKHLTGLKPVRPSYRARFAFLPGVSLRRPKASLKELVRPFFQWRNPHNLYVWLRRS